MVGIRAVVRIRVLTRSPAEKIHHTEDSICIPIAIFNIDYVNAHSLEGPQNEHCLIANLFAGPGL